MDTWRRGPREGEVPPEAHGYTANEVGNWCRSHVEWASQPFLKAFLNAFRGTPCDFIGRYWTTAWAITRKHSGRPWMTSRCSSRPPSAMRVAAYFTTSSAQKAAFQLLLKGYCKFTKQRNQQCIKSLMKSWSCWDWVFISLLSWRFTLRSFRLNGTWLQELVLKSRCDFGKWRGYLGGIQGWFWAQSRSGFGKLKAEDGQGQGLILTKSRSAFCLLLCCYAFSLLLCCCAFLLFAGTFVFLLVLPVMLFCFG